MAMAVRRNLRIHFAPDTACVDINITEAQWTQLQHAMVRHDGVVTMEITIAMELPLNVTKDWDKEMVKDA